MPKVSNRGFTLVEALVSVVILTVGLVATVSALGAIARAQTRTLESELMQRLALRKYDEIAALGILPTGQSQGDYLEIGEKRYIWRADRIPSGVPSLDTVRVQVARRSGDFLHGVEVQGLLCQPKVANP